MIELPADAGPEPILRERIRSWFVALVERRIGAASMRRTATARDGTPSG